jgi:hypothetical protein
MKVNLDVMYSIFEDEGREYGKWAIKHGLLVGEKFTKVGSGIELTLVGPEDVIREFISEFYATGEEVDEILEYSVVRESKQIKNHRARPASIANRNRKRVKEDIGKQISIDIDGSFNVDGEYDGSFADEIETFLIRNPSAKVTLKDAGGHLSFVFTGKNEAIRPFVTDTYGLPEEEYEEFADISGDSVVIDIDGSFDADGEYDGAFATEIEDFIITNPSVTVKLTASGGHLSIDFTGPYEPIHSFVTGVYGLAEGEFEEFVEYR